MTVSVTMGNIVKEYKIGHTTVKISDEAYRDKTPEEIEQILEQVTMRARDCLLAGMSGEELDP